MGRGTDWVGSKAKNNAQAAEPNSNIALVSLAKQLFGETEGLRTGINDLFSSILKTGGSQATTPIISNAVEASQRATSKTLAQTDEELARTGLAGTPFGANTRAGVLQEGNLSTSQIGPQIAMSLLQMIPGYLTGGLQTAFGGLGQGANNATNLTNTGGQMLSKALSLGK